jgi:predicted alpha/beta superfamily hydrolase
MSASQAQWKDYAEVAHPGEHSVTGTLKVCQDVWSPQLDNRRNVYVWLPASYARDDWRYPVIYMHDGQNLFDRATSFAGVEWQVDDTLSALGHEGIEAIIVGMPHSGERRMREYSPFADGPHYLAWIVETVKPLIDRDFRTLPERAHTGMMGSSLGGLISLYAFFHRPETFGFVGAFSPSLWVNRGAIFPYIRATQYSPGCIYLDNGTLEGDARPMYELLLQKGYRAGKDIRYVREEGGRHTEEAWARRLPDALRFLLR